MDREEDGGGEDGGEEDGGGDLRHKEEGNEMCKLWRKEVGMLGIKGENSMTTDAHERNED